MASLHRTNSSPNAQLVQYRDLGVPNPWIASVRAVPALPYCVILTLHRCVTAMLLHCVPAEAGIQVGVKNPWIRVYLHCRGRVYIRRCFPLDEARRQLISYRGICYNTVCLLVV